MFTSKRTPVAHGVTDVAENRRPRCLSQLLQTGHWLSLTHQHKYKQGTTSNYPFSYKKRIFKDLWDEALWLLNRKVVKFCAHFGISALCARHSKSAPGCHDEGQQWLWEVTNSAMESSSGLLQKETVSQETWRSSRKEILWNLWIRYNFLFMLMLTQTSSCKGQTVYFTFTIWSGEPPFMNSSQLLPVSDTLLWAIAFWIFLIIHLSLLIPSWSSPPGFQVIVIAVICVITTLCTEGNSEMCYSIKAKLHNLKKL